MKRLKKAITVFAIMWLCSGCVHIKYGEFSYTSWKKISVKYESTGDHVVFELRSNPEPWTEAINTAFELGKVAGIAAGKGM